MGNAHLPAAIKADLRYRFYAAVVFLSAVTKACEINRQPVQVSSHDFTTWNGQNSFETTFRDFVNRLCQFCDVKLGGDSVTAFTVLDLQDRIQYRFASNRRNKSQLTKAQDFIADILQTLQDFQVADHVDLRFRLLQKVLGFCRTRIHSYLERFIAACLACIKTRPPDALLLEQLRNLKRAASHADFRSLEEPIFTERCESLMVLVESLHGSPENCFRERVAQSSMNQSSNCWSELRHYAGRLISYYQGIRTMMTAAEQFPRLFENLEVIPVASSAADQNPIQKKISAEKILRTMVPTSEMAAYYQTLVEDTRALALDATIQEILRTKPFRPIVHAELLILQSLEKDGLVHPSNFYNSWKYIGSSKPTCRLCHCYFETHNGGFKVRPTHGNLYLDWKPPDVFQRDGEAAIKARERMLNAMVIPIRAEALRTLVEKVPLGKQHDSSTGMTLPILAMAGPGPSGAQADLETCVGDANDESFD